MSARVSDEELRDFYCDESQLGYVKKVAFDLREERAETARLHSIIKGLVGQVKAGAHMIGELKAERDAAWKAGMLAAAEIALQSGAGLSRDEFVMLGPSAYLRRGVEAIRDAASQR